MAVKTATLVDGAQRYDVLYGAADALDACAEQRHDHAAWDDGWRAEQLARQATLTATAARKIREAADALKEANDILYALMYDRGATP